MTLRRRAAALVLVLAITCANPGLAADAPAPRTPAELFVQDKVWTAHLAVSAVAWRTMEPPAGAGWGIMFTRRPTPADDPPAALAAAILGRGDANRDGRVDAGELRALAGRWFDRWDAAARAGTLDAAQLAAGLDAALDPEDLSRGAGVPIPLRATGGKRNGLASLFGWEFKQVPAALTFAGLGFKEVGLRYKGNGTFKEAQKSLKRSLKVDLNEFTSGQALAGVTKLNFHNNVTDPSGMAESIAYRLYREAGVPAPRTAYARVTVTVPGKHDRQYLGLYSVVENVDARFAQDRFGTRRGAIFKPVTTALFADLGDDWADYQQTYDPKTDVTAAQARRVIDFAHLVTYADDATFAARVGQFLDLDEFARYLAVTVFLSAIDGILYTGQNYYLYLDPASDKFQVIPWDLDHAFGGIFGEPAQLARLSVRKPWVGPNRFLERLFKVDAFERAYLARLREFAGTIFKPERLHAEVDALAAAIRPAVEAESQEKLATFDRAVATPPRDGAKGPAAFALFAPKPVRSIKRFVDARTPSVVDQLAGKSPGEEAKGLGGAWGRDKGGPGRALVPALLDALQAGADGRVNRAQFTQGFERWFAAWDSDTSGGLSREELSAGIEKDIALPMRRPPATRPDKASATPPVGG